jgi:hypothetical protein
LKGNGGTAIATFSDMPCATSPAVNAPVAFMKLRRELERGFPFASLVMFPPALLPGRASSELSRGDWLICLRERSR